MIWEKKNREQMFQWINVQSELEISIQSEDWLSNQIWQFVNKKSSRQKFETAVQWRELSTAWKG